MSDDAAFADLVAPYRGELHAHCYRMLGSAHDAEDALQETLLRAWRALRALRGPQLAALVAVHDRHQHLPDAAPAAAEADAAGRLRARRRPRRRPRHAARGVGVARALPDDAAPGSATSSARASSSRSSPRSSTCRPRQRAVLILREVLGFSRRRDRRGARHHGRVGQQRAAARAQGGRGARARAQPAGDAARARRRRGAGVVERYMDAMGRADVDAMVAMLAEDAAWSMPPLATLVRRPRAGARLPRARPAVGRVALAPPAGLGQRAGRRRGLPLGRGEPARTCRSRSTC